MQKFKTNIYEYFIVGIASFIAISVFLLSVHAKDIFHYQELISTANVRYDKISEKAASELHDHVDKQVLKSFSKSFGDTMAVSRSREQNYTPSHEEDPGLLARIQETLLIWRIYASLPFSV